MLSQSYGCLDTIMMFMCIFTQWFKRNHFEMVWQHRKIFLLIMFLVTFYKRTCNTLTELEKLIDVFKRKSDIITSCENILAIIFTKRVFSFQDVGFQLKEYKHHFRYCLLQKLSLNINYNYCFQIFRSDIVSTICNTFLKFSSFQNAEKNKN